MKAMAQTRTKALLAGLLMTVFLLAGCGSGGEDSQVGAPQDGSESTTFSLNLSSYSEESLGGQTSLTTEVEPQATAEVSGAMLIVASNGDRFGPFPFQAFFDAETLSLTTTLTVNLDPGLYTFFLLLELTINGVTNQYAAVSPVLIVDADENQVSLNLNPLLISGIDNVLKLENLQSISFDYPTDIATYTDPRFGLDIDVEQTSTGELTPLIDIIFRITIGSTGPVVLLLPEPLEGEAYVINCRFLDGSLVEQVCPGSQTPDPAPPEEDPPQVTPVPLEADATLDATAGEIVFRFPAEVVEEVDGVGNLQVIATVVGPETPVIEEELTDVTLSSSTDPDSEPSYEGTLLLSGFAEGTHTWSLNFFDLGSGARLFAYCADTGELSINSATRTCELNFIDQDEAVEFPVFRLSVTVSDGSPVSGAVVLVDDQPVGITSTGLTGTDNEGAFSFFLPGGDYQIRALHEALDPFGTGQVIRRESLTTETVSLTADLSAPVALQLDPLVAPAIEVVETIPADGDEDVFVDTVIQVTFSTEMDQTATENAFSTGPFVAGSFSWPAPEVMEFTPDAWLLHGTAYTVTIDGETAADTFGNTLGNDHTFSFTTEQAPPIDALTLTASFFRRPRHREDGFIDLTATTTIRVPTHNEVELVVDENGDLLGNPDKFLLFVYLGDVKCVYLGGKWKRYYGWVEEHITERAFKSPSCNRGVQPGDLLTLQPNEEAGDEDDEEDRFFHRNQSEIKARVVTGDRAFFETRLRVTIPVVLP